MFYMALTIQAWNALRTGKSRPDPISPTEFPEIR